MLPFQRLLDEIAAEGIPVGVREHLALGKLVGRYDGCSRAQFRDAVAALLGTSANEVKRIEAAFDRLYPDDETVVPAPPARPVRRRRWYVAAGAVAAVVAVVSAIVIVDVRGPDRTTQLPPVTPPLQPEDLATKTISPTTDDAPCAELKAQEYRESSMDLETLAAGAIAGLALVLVASAARGRRRLRRWRHDALRTQSAAIAGPRDYRIVVRPPVARDERAGVGPLATALGRAATESIPTTELNVPATLRGTLRGFPRLVFAFRARLVPHPVVVLEDTAADMAPWRGKVEALVAGLQRDGLSIVRLYFRHDATRVATSRDGVRGALADHGRAHPGSPLVVITWSGAVPADVVKLWPVRLRLSPVGDRHLWPASLRGEEIWPITRQGLLGAAHTLARRGRERPAFDDAPPVSSSDARLFAALLSLVPVASFDLAELVRARLFPHAPEELVLAARGWASGAPVRNARATLRTLDPAGTRERQLRVLLRSLIDGSEPVRGSAAHLRWRRDRALQLISLGDDAGAHELQALAASPLAEEVVVYVDASAGVVPRALRRKVATTAARPDGPRPRLLAWPHLGAVLLGTIVFAVGTRVARHEGARVMPRVVGYELASSGATPAGAQLSARRLIPIAPSFAVLRRDQQPYIPAMFVAATMTLTPGATASCYQLEAVANHVQFVSNVVRVALPVAAPPPPSLTGVTPRRGMPGATITLTGTGFAAQGRRVKSVAVGFKARVLRVVSDTQMTVATSASAKLGRVDISVDFDPGGRLALRNAFSFGSEFDPGGELEVANPLEVVTETRKIAGAQTIDADTVITATNVTIAAGAKLRVRHGARLRIEARTVVVEGPALIDGTGDPGAAGADARATEWTTSYRLAFEKAKLECATTARAGSPGRPGGRGARIELPSSVSEIKLLSVRVNGGRGGRGGRGAVRRLILRDVDGDVGAGASSPIQQDIANPMTRDETFNCPPGPDGQPGAQGPAGSITRSSERPARR